MLYCRVMVIESQTKEGRQKLSNIIIRPIITYVVVVSKFSNVDILLHVITIWYSVLYSTMYEYIHI